GDGHCVPPAGAWVTDPEPWIAGERMNAAPGSAAQPGCPMLTSRPMNPRALFPLASCLLAFALAACAPEGPTPIPQPVDEPQAPLPEPIPEPAEPAPLAPVPPPPEQRPEAPVEVTDPSIQIGRASCRE